MYIYYYLYIVKAIETEYSKYTSNSEIILFYTDKLNLNDDSFEDLSKKCLSDIDLLLDYSVVFFPLMDQDEPLFSKIEKEIFLHNDNIKSRYYKMIEIGCNSCGYKYPVINNKVERIKNIKEKDNIMELLIQILNSLKDIYEDEKCIKMINFYLNDCIFKNLYY